MKKEFPPFYIGQKVKCINISGLSGNNIPEVGKEYIVTSIDKICCSWTITIGIPSKTYWSLCSICRKRYPSREQRDFLASRFTTAIEDFQSISFSKVMEEEICSIN